MYCADCGSKHDPNANFCTNCGKSFTNTVVEIPKLQTSPTFSPQIKPNKNKSLLLILVAIIFIAILSSILIASTGKKTLSSNGTRTIMIYMVGSDLESEYGAAAIDIEEMLEANVNLEDVNIVLYTGGTKKWSNGFLNNAIYELANTEFKLIKEEEKKSMALPSTLTEFIDYTYDNYKADLYDIIFWNHGGGPIHGYGVDELYNNNMMAVKDIELGIKNSALSKNIKFEFIGFDACLMSSIEIASSFRNYANYFIASQETEPGDGWDYNFLKTTNRDTTSVELGKNIVDSFYDYYETAGFTEYWDISLSVIDLSKINNIVLNIDELFKDVNTSLNSGGYSSIVNKITKSKCFQCKGDNQSYDLIDLYGAVSELKTDYELKTAALLKNLNEAIIYQKTNINGAYGISIYYPYYTKSVLTKWLGIYNQLNFSEGYKEFLNNYTKTLVGEKIANFNFRNTFPVISKDMTSVSAKLDSEVLDNYHKGRYIIFKDMKDGYYSPVFSSSDTSLDEDGNLVANFKIRELTLVDKDGKSSIIGYEKERYKGYTTYELPVMLTYFGSDVPIDKWMHKSASIIVKFDDNTSDGKILGAVPITNADNLIGAKTSIDLTQWTTIQFLNHRYKIFDKNGNYTWDWIGAGSSGQSITGWEIYTKDSYSITFEDLDQNYDYYCLFVIADTQGNEYTTNPIKINK